MSDLNRVATELARWTTALHKKVHGISKLSVASKDAISVRAAEIVEAAARKKTLKVFWSGAKPLAVGAFRPLREPRVPKQQELILRFAPRSRSKLHRWIRTDFANLAKKAPRHSQMNVLPPDDVLLREVLERSGFNTRYEILIGDTGIALNDLRVKKSPSRDLKDLGLELKVISELAELKLALRLQKKSSRVSKNHGYFSHTASQLKKDAQDYRNIIAGKSDGRILGVYRKSKLVGLMVVQIHRVAKGARPNGGFSFFLDPSIQGLGISKTGYLLLLEYLQAKNVKSFHGGTSQPAIQSLGKVMKRRLQFVIYVKI